MINYLYQGLFYPEDIFDRVICIMFLVVFLIVIVGGVCVVWLMFHPVPIPTEHIAQCTAYYKLVTGDKFMYYTPVEVCP